MRPLMISFAAVLSGAAFGQSSGATPKFEIADVHVSAHPKSVGPTGYLNPRGMTAGFYRGGRLELRNASMLDLIGAAYGVKTDGVSDGPSWLGIDQFDVIASAPADSTQESLKAMLQALLADRFHLAIHNESRSLPAYALTAGEKPLLKPADGSGGAGCKLQPNTTESPEELSAAGVNGGRWEGMVMRSDKPFPFACRNMTMAAFAEAIPNLPAAGLGSKPVRDQTGLNGVWNFDVKWSTGFGAPSPSEITIFDAFKKQLGLNLDPASLAMPVLVVDSVDRKPTPNAPGVAEKLALPTEFEVAVIKPTDPSAIRQEGRDSGLFQAGDRVNMHSVTLKEMIMQAWGLRSDRMLVEGPKFLDTNHFDVVAKIPVPVLVNGRPAPADPDSRRLMLQALLKDRFKLTIHTEDRLAPGYVLVATPKVKLKIADPSSRTRQSAGAGPDGKIVNPANGRQLNWINVTMAQFVEELSMRGGAFGDYPPIVDATGIRGGYDITLSFSGPAGLRRDTDAGPATDPTGSVSVFEALEQQLGLKLELRKIPASFLVIDHVEEMPADN